MQPGGRAEPVRLKVVYKSPESLLGEFTKSVGRGGVRLESQRAVPVGTRFVFELRSVGVKESVEVSGNVVSVAESSPGKFVLHIRYEAPRGRQGLDAVIARIFEANRADVKREQPRIPVQVRAVENRPDVPTYRLHDLSLGGVGIDVEGPKLPGHVSVGTSFLMQMKLTSDLLVVHGEVAWAVDASANSPLPARFGVKFGPLSPSTRELVEDFLTLRALPAPPWIARLFFGRDAWQT